MLDDVLMNLAAHWIFVADHSVMFLSLVIGCAVAICLFQRDRIRSLRERTLLRDEQLVELQKKLKASSPSDALIKVGELTTKLESLKLESFFARREEASRAAAEAMASHSPTLRASAVEATGGPDFSLVERYEKLDSDLAVAVADVFPIATGKQAEQVN